MRPRLSPSRLDRVNACAKFVQIDRPPNDDVDANEGTMLHEAAEKVLKLGANPSELGLDPEQELAVRDATQRILDLKATGMTTLEYEQTMESTVTTRGRGDVLMYDTGAKLVAFADFKFTRMHNEHGLQMKGYAVCALERFPEAAQVTSIVIAPRIKVYSEEVYTREQLPALRAEIMEVNRRMLDPNVKPTVCLYCPDCEWNGRCPSQAASLEPITALAEMPIPATRILQPTSGADWARVLLFGSWLEDWYGDKETGMKKRAAQFVLAGGEVPGYNMISKAGRATIKKECRGEVLKELRGLGFTDDEVFGASNLAIGDLAEAHAATSLSTIDEVKKDVNAVLKKYMTTGQTSRYLARASKKPKQEAFEELEGYG